MKMKMMAMEILMRINVCWGFITAENPEGETAAEQPGDLNEEEAQKGDDDELEVEVDASDLLGGFAGAGGRPACNMCRKKKKRCVHLGA